MKVVLQIANSRELCMYDYLRIVHLYLSTMCICVFLQVIYLIAVDILYFMHACMYVCVCTYVCESIFSGGCECM